MTGHDIYERAVGLLGIGKADGLGYESEELIHRALDAINYIAEDLSLGVKISSLDEEISAADSVLHAVPFGVAMFLTLIEGDGEKHAVFCQMYNAKRAAAKGSVSKVQDTLPVCEAV